MALGWVWLTNAIIFENVAGLSSGAKIQGRIVRHNIGTHCMMWHYLNSMFEKETMAGRQELVLTFP